MSRYHGWGPALLLGLGLAALACAGDPYWSSADQGTAERDELRQRIATLTAERTADRAELERLRARVAELEDELRGAVDAQPAAPAPTGASATPASGEEVLIAPRPRAVIEASDLELTAGPAVSAPQQLYDRAFEQLQRQQLDGAESSFAEFLARFPASDLADNAQYWIGEARLRRGEIAEAMTAFRRVVEDYPQGNKVPDALFKVAHCLGEQGDRPAAEEVYRELAERYPESAAAELALRRLGRP